MNTGELFMYAGIAIFVVVAVITLFALLHRDGPLRSKNDVKGFEPHAAREAKKARKAAAKAKNTVAEKSKA